jgi:ribonuclease D
MLMGCWLQGALGTALERSRQLCMHLYEKPLFTAAGPTSTYIQHYNAIHVQLNQKQQAAFAALVAWRDVTCRKLDEGIGRMMPKWLLVALSQKLPQTAAEVSRLAKKLIAKEYSKEVCLQCDFLNFSCAI